MTARTRVAITAPRISEKNSFMELNEFESSDEQVDGLDAKERNEDAAQPVDEQVALENCQRTDRLVGDAAQRQRDQRDDNQRIEDHGAQDRAGGAVQMH